MDQDRPGAGSFKPLMTSAERLPASMDREAQAASYAAERARLLLGCYRTGDANDPETYVAAITAILSKYPAWVMTTVTHPAMGLPSQKNWLPTIKEVTDACNAAIAPIAEMEARSERVKQQFSDRERISTRSPTYDELQEKYGKNFGMGQAVEEAKQAARVPAPTADQLKHHYTHYNLGFVPKESTS